MGWTEEAIVHSVEVLGTQRPLSLRTKAGNPLDRDALDKDVRELWATGSFNDIRVETTPEPQGTDVVFRVVEKPRLYLNKILYDPPKAAHSVNIPVGSPMDLDHAQEAARVDQRQLVADGYRDARVEPELVPAGVGRVDLRLHETPGPRYVVRKVRFTGDPVLGPKELRNMLSATRARMVIPLLWTHRAPLSDEAIGSDTERLRSLYISHGYLEPRIRLGDVKYEGHKAFIDFRIQAGSLSHVRGAQLIADGRTVPVPVTAGGEFPSAGLCGCLFDERRKAEAAGKMDFNVQLRLGDASGFGNPVDLKSTVDTGAPYRVGRINILGSRKFSDLTVRRALVLNEGDVFDWRRLRRSAARVDELGFFEPLGDNGIHIERHEALQTADITFTLKDKPKGRWALSGPVGPASVGGPLQALIQTRLPPWGRGLLEASTYFLTFTYVGFASPALSFLPGALNKRFFYVIGLERPYLPGQAWLSGFTISPQLGWQGFLMSYGTRHLYAHARKALAGGFAEPAIEVPVERTAGGTTSSLGYLLCEQPRSHWIVPRTAARIVLDLVMGNLTPF